MLKVLKKICISIVVLCICISPLSNEVYGVSSISRERVCSSQESQQTGCEYAVHVGDVTYTHYYQGRGFYSNDLFKHTGKTRTIKRAGCGYTSCASILTGYGKQVTPRDTVKAMNSAFNYNSDIATCMSKFGVAGRWIGAGKTAKEYQSIVEKALSEGKPVIALMSAAVGPDTFWTTGGHFVAIVGQDENYMWTCDSGYTLESHAKYTGKVARASRYMRGVWVPNQAPSGNSGETFVPSGGDDDPLVPTIPPSGSLEVTWEINNEIPDMDNLGDFKYKGNPEGMEINASKKPMEWVFKSLVDFVDYILGMLFTVVKIAIVGTVENIDNLINGAILKIEQIEEDIHYTIEDLVYNRVPLLDPNILSGTSGGVELQEGSILYNIRLVISSWYVGFRNVSILIIFVMLIYTGLRMAITNSSKSKADFKNQLFTWIKCMALVFTLHYVIFFVLNINNTLVNLFDPSNNTANGNILYNTIKTRAYDFRLSVGFTGTIMYIILFIYWIKFLIIYIKRLLKIILLVITAPFVIARYALDNATAKGKKAYKDWLHEFVSNVLIQSLHALEYSVLIGIAIDIGSKSIAGFIIALIFLSQMLKFDEVILSILKFDGEDMGGRIKPLKEPLHLKTYLNYKYAQTAIKLTGKAAKAAGRGVSTLNSGLKDLTGLDPLGAVDNAKSHVLNAKDELLRNTIGQINDERNAEYSLRIASREKDERGKSTNRAKQAKKTLKKYKKDKKKRYKAQREQFIGKSRFLSTAVGVGKFTIGTALMTQNLTAGMMMAGLTPGEIKEAIVEHDKRVDEYKKNKEKIDELGETIRDLNTSNRFEDEIEDEISRMNGEKRKKAIKELLQLSSLNGNSRVIDDAISDYMKKHNIKVIDKNNIDKILESTFDTIDPNNILTTRQKENFVKELKKNLRIKRESEWRNLTGEGDSDRQPDRDRREERHETEPREEEHNEGQDRREEERTTTDRRRTRRDTADRRKSRRDAQDRRTTRGNATGGTEPRTESRETFISSFTREDVSNMFSQSIQNGIVSEENRELATKINEMQDMNYKSIKRNKKKINNTNRFMGNLKHRYK